MNKFSLMKQNSIETFLKNYIAIIKLSISYNDFKELTF